MSQWQKLVVPRYALWESIVWQSPTQASVFGSWNQPFLKREDTENVYKNAPVPDEHFFSYRVPSRILEVPEDWRILEFCQFLENLRESWIFHRIEYIHNDMCSFLQQHCTDRFWLQSFAPPRPPPIKSRVSTVLLSQIGTFSDCNGKCENQMEIKCRKEYLIIMSTKGALSTPARKFATNPYLAIHF